MSYKLNEEQINEICKLVVNKINEILKPQDFYIYPKYDAMVVDGSVVDLPINILSISQEEAVCASNVEIELMDFDIAVGVHYPLLPAAFKNCLPILKQYIRFMYLQFGEEYLKEFKSVVSLNEAVKLNQINKIYRINKENANDYFKGIYNIIAELESGNTQTK